MRKLKIYAAAFGGVGIVGGFGMYSVSNDLNENYTPTQAVITELNVDCYIENRKEKIENKTTGELSYMDCTMAPLVAVRFDMDESDIKQRVKATYTYRSHVDGREYVGSFERRGRNRAEDFQIGGSVPVFAHNRDADESRTSSSNIFVDDAYEI